MSGAAGAIHPLRRPASGSMSAQALLSMIAPALPAAPQGAPAGDAMAFEGLLAAMLDGETPSTEADLDPALADPAANDDAPAAVASVMVAPPPPPVALVAALPTMVSAPPAAGAAEENPMAPPASAAPDLLVPPSEAVEATADARPVDGEAAPAAPSSAATAPGVGTQSAPIPSAPAPLASSASDRPATTKAAPPVAEAPQADPPAAEEIAPSAPTPAIAAKTGPEQAPRTPLPTPILQPAPQPLQPPALRALAERTSRPLEAAPAGDAVVADPRAASSAASASAVFSGGLADAPPPVDAAPVVAREAAGAETPDEPAAEPLPAETASAAPAVHTAREAAAPTLSRTAIDATAQIAAHILKKLEGRSTRFEMALTPDDLGRVDVKLDIDAEGRLSARLAFDNPAAAADLRGRADDLRRELQQAGFHVAEDAFEFAERDSGSSAFDRGQDAREGQARAFARTARMTAEADARLQPLQGWTSLSLTPSGVDLKV